MATTDIKAAQAQDWVGVFTPDASKVRVEIDEFVGDNEMTNLYLLALEAMQQEDPTKTVRNGNEDWWTFYSLSGIHGQPPENWNGIQDTGRRNALGSYCTHGELVFPTWHRVYINMFEQAVANKIQDIASHFTTDPEKSLYESAANRFRLPFWDPFLPRNPITTPLRRSVWGYPKILTTPEVWVKRPGSNNLEPIANPLYSFRFPNDDLSSKGRTSVRWNSRWGLPPDGDTQTSRTPGSDGQTDVADLEAKLRAQIPSLGTNLWKLLSRYTDPQVDHDNTLRSWASFATHNQIDPRTDQPIRDSRGRILTHGDTTVSLESWHDNIHGLIGTGNGYQGHMGNPAIAGFDPIFWLHHCNVDRLLAIYQALYPDKWLRQGGDNGLFPFQKTATKFWNSTDIRDWTKLGYAIPGNKPLNAQGQQALETHLSDYYNWVVNGSSKAPASVAANWPRDLSTSIALNGDQARPTTAPVVRFEAMDASNLVTRTVTVKAQSALKVFVDDKPKQVVINDAAEDTAANPPQTVKEGSTLTWNARVRVKKFAYNGPFNIHLFIGYVKENQPERFVTKKNEVGLTSIFATPDDSPCANCRTQRAEGMVYEDAIPISHALYAYLKTNTAPETDGPLMTLRTLDSFEPEHVVPFLKQNLKWVLTDLASNLLGDQQALIDSGLEVAVSARKYDLPTQDKPLGLYYPPTTYGDITSDKIGGFGYVAPTPAT